ncbi:MAG: VWA domain-containing protein [Caldisphaeraceae archaeon]|nr:VWA domain-containing protein [Caldisphaeraceae archaeon]
MLNEQKAIETALIAIKELKSKGVKISISQEIDIIRMIESYCLLGKGSLLSYNELARIFLSVLAKNDSEERAIKEGLKSVVFDEGYNIEEEIIGAKQRLGNKAIVPRRLNEREYIDYIRLRAAGALVRKGDHFRAINESTLRNIVNGVKAEGHGSYEKKIISLIQSLDAEEILKLHRSEYFSKSLEKLPMGKLIRIAELLNKRHYKKELMEVGKVIKEKIMNGEKVNAERLWNILKPLGLLNKEVKVKLALQDRSLIRRLDIKANDLEPEDVYTDLVPLILKHLVKNKRNDENIINFIEKADPKHLWKIKKMPIEGIKGKMLNSAIFSSAALKEATEFLKTGDMGRKDMSQFYLEKAKKAMENVGNDASIGKLNKVMVSQLIEKTQRLLESIEKGEVVGNLQLELPLAIDFFRALYRRPDEIERIKLEKLAKNYLTKALKIKGFKTLPLKEKTHNKPGRLLIKETTMNYIRSREEFLVYKRNAKGKKITLVLDTSSSMAEYASWALSIAALFVHNISRLILFSTKPIVYDRPKADKVINLLLSLEFEGYTDIYNALKEIRGAKQNIVITDLKQTVKSGDPSIITKRLIDSGFKIVYILPEKHDKKERELVEDAGGLTKVVRSPERAAKEIIKIIRR